MVEVYSLELSEQDLSRFEKSWLKNSGLDKAKENYSFLRRLGLEENYIIKNPHLLGLDLETLEDGVYYLRKIGVTDETILKRRELIGRNKESLKEKYGFLRNDVGLTETKIKQNIHLLSLGLDTLKNNYQFLKGIGLKKSKFNTHPSLLGENQESLIDKYQKLINLGLSERNIETYPYLLKLNKKTIRNKYQRLRDFLDKEFVLSIPSLLGNDSQTVSSNVSYLSLMGLDYNTYKLLLNTKPQTKRKKLAYLLRKVFDYRNLSEEQKKSALRKVYELARKKPILLVQSKKTLESKVESLKQEILDL